MIFVFPIVSCLKQKYKQEQAGAELGQAQDKLKVIVEVPVKIGADVEVLVNYYKQEIISPGASASKQWEIPV